MPHGVVTRVPFGPASTWVFGAVTSVPPGPAVTSVSGAVTSVSANAVLLSGPRMAAVTATVSAIARDLFTSPMILMLCAMDTRQMIDHSIVWAPGDPECSLLPIGRAQRAVTR